LSDVSTRLCKAIVDAGGGRIGRLRFSKTYNGFLQVQRALRRRVDARGPEIVAVFVRHIDKIGLSVIIGINHKGVRLKRRRSKRPGHPTGLARRTATGSVNAEGRTPLRKKKSVDRPCFEVGPA
jgi:hypothetical protein